jgi:hypothetical protein
MKAENGTDTPKKAKSAKLLGIGLDNEDGHTRMTRGKNFVLCGGSEDTHTRMQETAIKVNEQLDRKGKRLEDVTPNEMVEILERAAQ